MGPRGRLDASEARGGVRHLIFDLADCALGQNSIAAGTAMGVPHSIS